MGDDEQAGRAQAHVEVLLEAIDVPAGHAIAHLREQCRGERDAEYAIGELIPHPCVAYGRRAVGRDMQCTGVHERERDEVDGRA